MLFTLSYSLLILYTFSPFQEVVYCCLACLFMLVVAAHLIVDAHGAAIVYVGCVSITFYPQTKYTNL